MKELSNQERIVDLRVTAHAKFDHLYKHSKDLALKASYRISFWRIKQDEGS